MVLRRERLLWGKFAFSAIGAIVIAEILVIFSDILLGVAWAGIALHALTVIILATGLSGLSVGLGACIPNFRESDPSKIAVGFGGTLNLITGLLFLLLVIGLMAVPYHIYEAAEGFNEAAPSPLLMTWLLVGIPAGVIVGLFAVLFPLQAGASALKRMEF